MSLLLLGVMFTTLQEDPAADQRRLPFETGQLAITAGLDEMRACAASGQGRGYQALAALICEAGAPQPPPNSRRTVVIGFVRSGESHPAPSSVPGRRAYHFEADVELDASGEFAACRLVREEGARHLYFHGPRACDALLRERRPFAAANGAGLRQGRLRISIFLDAPEAEIARLLQPPRTLPPIAAAPPPIMMTPLPPPAPPPPPPPRSGRSSPPQAIGRHDWFGADDYPSAALRAEEEGTVRARLEISPEGRVTGCTIVSSSGSASLDAAACRIFRSRARYRPATDARGRPAAGAIIERVRWVYPEFDPIARVPAYAALSVRFDGEQRVFCEALDQVPEDSALASAGCRLVVPLERSIPYPIHQGRDAVRILLEVTGGRQARPEFTPPEGRTLFALSASFSILPDGGVDECSTATIVRPREGADRGFDLCAALRSAGQALFDTRSGAPPDPARLMLTVIEGVPAP